jgi:hypothetical protein
MTKTEELPDVEPKKVANLYSRTDILKAISEFFNDVLPRMDYEEEHFWVNIRIILCIVCCSFGAYAQFMTKFPKDSLILGLCVVGYFAFSGILALIDYQIIKTSVMCMRLNGDAVFLDVTMPAFSHEVTFVLRSRKKQVEIKGSIASYFDLEGYLSSESLMSEFTALVSKYEKEAAPTKKDKKA